METENRRIVFYDGECGLCNRVVQFILNNEKSGSALQFASLQSDFARDFFCEKGISIQMDTFYFYDGINVYGKSNACFKLLNHLRWYWKCLYFGKVIPRFIADKMYDTIARNRKNLLASSCVLIPVNSERFLG